MSDVKGVDFTALQVRDLDRATEFYTEVVGLPRAPQSPPDAVVFATRPIPFAVRRAAVDLDASPELGWGVALWFLADDARVVHKRVTDAGRPIISEPAPGPFGTTFSFADPDGYVITVHDNG
jgi:predicted enzyme related to lactoylglutathione lyase